MFHPQVAALAPHPSLVQGDSEVSDLGWVELVLGVPATDEPLLLATYCPSIPNLSQPHLGLSPAWSPCTAMDGGGDRCE